MKLSTFARRAGICYTIADFVSILYSFCARLYGQRRAKRKTEKIVQDLNVKAGQKIPQEAGEQRAAR